MIQVGVTGWGESWKDRRQEVGFYGKSTNPGTVVSPSKGVTPWLVTGLDASVSGSVK